MAISGMLNKAKESASKVKSEAATKLGALQDVGSEKINELLQQFNEARPHFRKAGYMLSQLEITAGLPPTLKTHFQHTVVDQAEIDQAFVELESNALGTNMLTMLVKAAELQKKIKVKEMSFSFLEIEVGGIPKVTLRYEPE